MKENREMHAVVYLVLGIGVFAYAMRLITKSIAYLVEAINGHFVFPYETLICPLFIYSFVMAMRGNKIGVQVFLFSQLVDASVCRNPLEAIIITNVLLLVLQIKKNGVSAWRLIIDEPKTANTLQGKD